MAFKILFSSVVGMMFALLVGVSLFLTMFFYYLASGAEISWRW